MSNIISLDDYKRRKREKKNEPKKSIAKKIREALEKFGSHDKKQDEEEE